MSLLAQFFGSELVAAAVRQGFSWEIGRKIDEEQRCGGDKGILHILTHCKLFFSLPEKQIFRTSYLTPVKCNDFQSFQICTSILNIYSKSK